MTFDPTLLIQYGALGIVLLWFMLRMEKRIDRHSQVLNDFVEIFAIDVLSRDGLPVYSKERAQQILSRTQSRSQNNAGVLDHS